MLEGGFSDGPKDMEAWLLVLQRCSRRLAEELLKAQGEEGPPRGSEPGSGEDVVRGAVGAEAY